MRARKQFILEKLMREEKLVTSEQLANLANVSSRTVRNDLKSMNQDLREKKAGATILTLPGQGYKLKVNKAKQFKHYLEGLFNEGEAAVPIEPEDRAHFLLKKVLLSSNYIKLDHLVDEMFVSYSTLKNDLRDVKISLEKYQLQLITRPNYGLKLKGEEKNIRYAISENLFKRTKMDICKLDQQNWLLPAHELDLIRFTILNELKKVQLNLSDTALNNLVIHIAIACKRIMNQQYIEWMNHDQIEIKEKKEYNVAEKIIDKIGKDLGLSFPALEISYVAMHLLGTKLFFNEQFKNIAKSFDEETLRIVSKMISRVEDQLFPGVSKDKELYAGIAIHLKPALQRFRFNMDFRNPMLEDIKLHYPLAFEAGVLACQVIEEECGFDVNESEIGYISLHFGAAFERAKMESKPKSCLIVCTTGLGSSQLLLSKMRVQFGNKLTVVGATELHNLSEKLNDSIDFIVSTVPLPDWVEIPYIIVSTIFGDDEISRVEDLIMKPTQSIVDQYLKDDLIFLHLDLETPKEVIEFLGNKLIDKGYTNEGIVESVLTREEAASTSYGNLVAIPHSLTPQSKETFWTLATLKKPIIWGGNKAQFVCLLHVANENEENLEPMYDSLMHLLDDYSFIQHLLEIDEPEQMKKDIKNKLER